MAVRVTIPWRPGQMRPTRLQQTYLHRIARMVQLNDRVVLAVYNWARYAPTSVKQQREYCGFLRGAVRRIPLIHDVEIWNEANSPTYWPEDRGATAYAALLARCYDVLPRPAGTDQRDQLDRLPARPGRVRLLARRRLPRQRAHPPALRHVRAQPVPGELGGGAVCAPPGLRPDRGGRLRDLDERAGHLVRRHEPASARDAGRQHLVRGGRFQTVPPQEKRRYYHGRENDLHAIPALIAHDDSTRVDQATQLREAILLAYCQPAVSGFLNFGLLDEDRLGGWQSGLLWRDGTRKPSYDTFKAAIARSASARHGLLEDPGAPGRADRAARRAFSRRLLGQRDRGGLSEGLSPSRPRGRLPRRARLLPGAGVQRGATSARCWSGSTRWRSTSRSSWSTTARRTDAGDPRALARGRDDLVVCASRTAERCGDPRRDPARRRGDRRDPGRGHRVRPRRRTRADRADRARRRRCRLRLAPLGRQATARLPLLAPGRQPISQPADERPLQHDALRHGDGLQGVPHRGAAVARSPRGRLRDRAGDHGEGVQAASCASTRSRSRTTGARTRRGRRSPGATASRRSSSCSRRPVRLDRRSRGSTRGAHSHRWLCRATASAGTSTMP